MSKNSSYFLLMLLMAVILAGCQFTKTPKKKQVVVTAPSIYNTRLCQAIDQAAMQAIPLPVIETTLIQQNEKIDPLLKAPDHYDWIVLPSRNAIKAFFHRAQELRLLEEVKNANYCAIGKDQEYLRSFGVSSILKNTEPSPQGIANALKTQEKKTGTIAILAPRVKGMPEPNVVPDFMDSLTAYGWQTKRIDAYTTQLCQLPGTPSIISKIKNGDVDLIAFTSTAEIQALITLVGGIENLSKVPIACFGPYTSANAQQLGLKPAFIADDYSSFQGYVKAMTQYFTPGKGNR